MWLAEQSSVVGADLFACCLFPSSTPRCRANSWRWCRNTTPPSRTTGSAARAASRGSWKLVSAAESPARQCSRGEPQYAHRAGSAWLNTGHALQDQADVCAHAATGFPLPLWVMCQSKTQLNHHLSSGKQMCQWKCNVFFHWDANAISTAARKKK